MAAVGREFLIVGLINIFTEILAKGLFREVMDAIFTLNR